MSERSRAALVPALAALVALVLALPVRPQGTALEEGASGDARLAADVSKAVGDERGRRGLAVASVEGGRVSTAGLGARGPGVEAAPSATTPFEIGSLTKVLTAMLLAELASDGTVRLGQPVSDLLPRLRGTAAGKATLEELATHHSGLPRLPPGARGRLRAAVAQLAGENPYAGITVASLIDSASGGATDARGEFAYSNLGMALLGQALAAATDTSYPELLERRILRPLSMRDTDVLGPEELPPPGAAVGSWSNGRPVSTWPSAGIAPAGGVWSTTADLARLLTAVLEGRAPGAKATRPRHPAGRGRRIGLGWISSRHANATVTWHNGRTGGYAAWAGYEPRRRRAAVVLANTSRSVDAVGLRLLGVDARSEEEDAVPALDLLLTAVGTLGGGVALVTLAHRRRRDRLRIVDTGLDAVALLALSAVLGAWQVLPPVLWLAGAALAGGGLAHACRHWTALPVSARGRPALRWMTILASGAFAVLAVLLAV